MGIPHLTAQIKPFAKQISWHIHPDHSTREKKDLQNLVIDGPALAYHIHHQCLSTHLNARHVLDAIPTYRELGSATIAWLEKMETFGFYIKHIFFDGYLPKSKTDIRNDRLSKYLLQLKAFRSSTASLFPTDSPYGAGKPMAARHKALPAAPFLVPCVMDALFASKYSSRTRSVPCEAEVQCTNSASLEPDDIILTSDSDMLLLANSNSIIFLSDITTLSQQEPDDTCCADYYNPAETCAKLGCPDFVKLAFFLSHHPHRTLKELAKQAAAIGNPPGYEEFRAQFLPENQYSKFASSRLLKGSSQLASVIDRLDPRIAELVQQWLSDLKDTTTTTTTTETGTGEGETTRHIYLPFLLDDPTRASAWRPSLPIRTLAYSLFTLLSPGARVKMLEADRRGDRILDVAVPLLESADATSNACRTLLESLPQLQSLAKPEKVSTSSAEDTWTLHALSSLVTTLHQTNSPLPSATTILETLLPIPSSQPHQSQQWPHVHLNAQLQGHLYSLRILFQTLSVLLSFPSYITEHNTAFMVHRHILRDLAEKLREMPSLDGWIYSAGVGGEVQKEVWRRGEVERLVGCWLGGEGRDAVGEGGKRRKVRKKGEREEEGERKRKVVGMQRARVKGGNMYNLLNDDGDA